MPPNRMEDTSRMRAERGCVVAGITAGAGAADAGWDGDALLEELPEELADAVPEGLPGSVMKIKRQKVLREMPQVSPG